MSDENDPVLKELKALRREVNWLCISVIALALGVLLLLGLRITLFMIR